MWAFSVYNYISLTKQQMDRLLFKKKTVKIGEFISLKLLCFLHGDQVQVSNGTFSSNGYLPFVQRYCY